MDVRWRSRPAFSIMLTARFVATMFATSHRMGSPPVKVQLMVSTRFMALARTLEAGYLEVGVRQ